MLLFSMLGLREENLPTESNGTRLTCPLSFRRNKEESSGDSPGTSLSFRHNERPLYSELEITQRCFELRRQSTLPYPSAVSHQVDLMMDWFCAFGQVYTLQLQCHSYVDLSVCVGWHTALFCCCLRFLCFICVFLCVFLCLCALAQ